MSENELVGNYGISICISAYNTKDYIKKTLDSIAGQTWFLEHNNYEIILGIDGDNELLEYIKTIQNDYNNFRVYMFKNNVGTYIVSNTIIKMAKYPYVVRFDSDDIMKPYMIEKLMNITTEYDCVGYYCLSVRGSIPSVGSMMFKKSTFEKYGGYRPWKCAADREFFNRMLPFIKSKRIREDFYDYTYRDGSLMHSSETGSKSRLRKLYHKAANSFKYEKWEDAVINCKTAECVEVLNDNKN